MGQLPKYTAQLKDQLLLKRSQAYMAAMIITMGPPIAVSVIVEDPRIYELIIKPLTPFFLIYAGLIWACTLVYALMLTMRIKNLTDANENRS